MKRFFFILFLFLFLFSGMNTLSDTAQAEPVRMAYLQNDIHHLALWVAIEKDFFKQQGVSIEIKGVFRAGPEIMTAFAAGGLDMAYVGEAPTTTAVANKAAKVVVVAQANTEGSALVVKKENKSIQTLLDLSGKTIAIPGHSTVQDFLLKKAFVKQGIDPKDVNIIVIKPPEMIGALRTGQIDAFIAWEPYPSKAATMNVGRNLSTSADMWKDHPCCVLAADAGFLSGNSEKVKAVVRAHVQATGYIRQNPKEAVKIGVKYTGMDETTVRHAMSTVNYTPILSINGEKEYVDFLRRLGYIKVEDSKAFVDQLINKDYLEK